jgi:hypothetical protein
MQTSMALRTFLAILILVAAFVAAIAAVAITGMSYTALGGSLALLVAGFLGLHVARGSRSPAAPLRITIVVCCLIASAMVATGLWPPAHADILSGVILVGMIAVSLFALMRVSRQPRLAIVLLSLPALTSLWIAARLVRTFHASGGAEMLGPSATLAYFVAATMAAGWMVAPWHASTASPTGSDLDRAS